MSEQDTENAETQDEQLSVGEVVEEIAAEQAETTDGTADTGSEAYEPTDAQVEMAKQLGLSDGEISDMTEAEAEAYDKVARLDSRRQQRKGKEEQKKDEEETSTSAESSTDGDDEFTDDDWYSDAGRKKFNKVLRAQKEQAARDAARSQETQTSEKDRLKATADKVFDALDPEIFSAYSPGETADIDSTSPAQDKRNEAVEMAEAIQSASKTDISMEEAIERALAIVAPTETENAALNETNNRRRKRGSQRVGAPASSTQTRNQSNVSPEDKAIDAIHAYVNG